MLNKVFGMVVVLVVLYVLTYFVYMLHNSSVVFMAVRLSNQSDQTSTTNQMFQKLMNFLDQNYDGQNHPHLTTHLLTKDTNLNLEQTLPLCQGPSPLLAGPVWVDLSKNISLDMVEEENPDVRLGGWSGPMDCLPSDLVAVLVPFRCREEHLKKLLHYLHPFLQRQRIYYKIYVIHQAGEGTFNRAKLLNAGFIETSKEFPYNCFIFHDVDLIPMDDRNIYNCGSQPRHLSVSVDKFNFQLPYSFIFGGVTALTSEQFQKINGYSNSYWGWGGEDDDISQRITLRGMTISRPDQQIGKYHMIQHKMDLHNEVNPHRFNQMAKTHQDMDTDGVNSVTYSVVKVERHILYTNITVDVGTP